MPRGGRKPGVKFGGRQKGTPNKKKLSFRENLRAYCDQLGVDPHKFMAEMIASAEEVVVGVDEAGKPLTRPAVSQELKLNAAKELAQYIEPKLKAVEHSGDPDKPLVVRIRRA